MADKKISQLTAATTPLAGTEVAPIVQSGSTVKVTVQDIANMYEVAGNQSSASSDGWLSSTDWSTFNNKQPAGSYALTTGNLSQFASTTSDQLAGVISDETGSGSLVFATSPTLVTPALGVASANQVTITPTSGDAILYMNSAVTTNAARINFQASGTNTWAVGRGSGTGSNNFEWYNYNTSSVTTTFFTSGGVSIGNTTDPGATNLSVSGNGYFGTTANIGAATWRGVFQSAGSQLALNDTRTSGGYCSLGFHMNNTLQTEQYQDGANDWFVIQNTSGGVYLSNGATSWASMSDERLKDIIEPITNATSKVAQLRSVIGKYKTDKEGTRRSFVIAQDVEKVLPEAVSSGTLKNSDDDIRYLNVSYSDLIPLLIAAVNELSAEVSALKGK